MQSLIAAASPVCAGSGWQESQRHAVVAVALAGGAGAVVEDVALVPSAARSVVFGAGQNLLEVPLGSYRAIDLDGYTTDANGFFTAANIPAIKPIEVKAYQTGYIYHYAFIMLIGVALLITYFIFTGGGLTP